MCRRLLLLAVVLSCLGCGGYKPPRPVFPVKLQIFAGEQPARGAVVVLHPPEDTDEVLLRPRGEVDDQGWVAFTTYRTGDGVPAGDYFVGIEWPQFGERPEGSNPDSEPPSFDRLNGRFKNGRQSGLRVTVPDGGGDLPRIFLR